MMRVHPQAARLEAVTHATDKSVRAVLATLHQITGVQPTARKGPGRRHRITKVARHDRVAPDQQLADLTRRHRVILVVADPHVEAWDHMSHGPADRAAGTVGEVEVRRFGRAEAVDEFEADVALHGIEDRLRQRLPSRHRKPDSLEGLTLNAAVRDMPCQARPERRHPEHHGDAALHTRGGCLRRRRPFTVNPRAGSGANGEVEAVAQPIARGERSRRVGHITRLKAQHVPAVRREA